MTSYYWLDDFQLQGRFWHILIVAKGLWSRSLAPWEQCFRHSNRPKVSSTLLQRSSQGEPEAEVLVVLLGGGGVLVVVVEAAEHGGLALEHQDGGALSCN